VALMSSIFPVRSNDSYFFSGDTYLPHAKAHQVMLCPDGPDSNTGFIKVLSSPKHPRGKSPSILEPYSIVNGLLV